MEWGSEFHILGAATANDLSPQLIRLVLVILSSTLSADLSEDFEAT